MTSCKQPQIAIIGAGPAGLTLGVLLHKQGIQSTIFELRSKPTEEEFAQTSGSLDLHEDTGLAAIKACGLQDEFVTLAGECAEAFVVSDKEGNILHRHDGDGQRPEISRHALVKMLLNKLPSNYICWEHKLLAASPSQEQGRHDLDFGDNGIRTFDLVIGADGAWSRVRPLVTATKPSYSGVHFITLTIPNLDSRFPHLGELVGPGTFSAPGEHNIVMCQRGTKGSARIYLSIRTDEENFSSLSGLDTASPAEAKHMLLGTPADNMKWKFFDSFGPKLQELITRGLENVSGPLDIKPLYMLPVGKLAWQFRAGVSLIGDAAHLMTPFAGEGVNLAMRDALDLSIAIKEAWNEDCHAFGLALEGPLSRFEADMFDRSEITAEETWKNLQLFTSENAAQDCVAMFKRFDSMGMPEIEG